MSGVGDRAATHHAVHLVAHGPPRGRSRPGGAGCRVLRMEEPGRAGMSQAGERAGTSTVVVPRTADSKGAGGWSHQHRRSPLVGVLLARNTGSIGGCVDLSRVVRWQLHPQARLQLAGSRLGHAGLVRLQGWAALVKLPVPPREQRPAGHQNGVSGRGAARPLFAR